MSYGRAPLIIIVAGRAGVAIAGIAAVRLSTALLTPAQLGSISQLNSMASFFSMLLIIPVMHFMNRGFLEWYDAGLLKTNLRRYLVFILAASIAAFLIGGIIEWQFDLVKGFGFITVALFMGAIMLLQAIYSYGTSGLNLLGERTKFVVFSNLVAWSSIAFSIIFFWWRPGALAWSLGQVVSFLVGSFSLFVIWKRLQHTKQVEAASHLNSISFSTASIIRFSWPIAVTSALWWLQSQSYRFILDKIQAQGLGNVGLFTVAYGLAATPIAIYESIIGQYLDPAFFGDLKNKDREGQTKAWNNYAKLYLPGLILTGIFIITATPFLAKLLLGEAFRQVAIKVTVWAAVIETMRASSSLMFHLGIAKTDNRMTMLAVAVGAVLAPTGVYFFGRIDPLYGTIAGLLLAGTAVLLINIALSHKVLPITWPVGRVLYVLLLGIPLLICLPIIHYFFPEPGFLLAFLVVLLSGIYTAVMLALLLKKKEE